MKSAAIALIATLALAGCASTNPPQASAAQMRALAQCHVDRAATLDDRQSDAATIGRAVHRACYEEATQAMLASVSTWASPAYRDGYDASFMQQAAAHATQAVLEARAERLR